jgi:Family of unknown function (DUF6526)
MPEQSYKNHAQFVPMYHGVLTALLGINLGWATLRMARSFSTDTVVGVVLAVALLLITFYARFFALRVQDRVIRLEMRLRLREILPADLAAHVPELTIPQLVAMRFASDAEMPDLMTRVLKDGIRDSKTIKQMVRDWQPDRVRA